MCSKQVGATFSFFCRQPILHTEMCVKASERLLFSLFIINHYCTPNASTKNLFKIIDRLRFS